MKRTLLLTTAAVALTLGFAPAFAQDHTDSKMKGDPAATEQHERDTNRHSQKAMPERGAKEAAPAAGSSSSRNATNKDNTASPKTAGQADAGKADTKPSAANAENSKSETPKSADSKSSNDQPKRAEDRNQKTPGAAAVNKSGTTEPSKSAQQNDTRAPAAQKSTQSKEPDRNARSNDTNRNAQANEPKSNTAEGKNASEPKARLSASLDPQKKSRLTTAFAKVDVKPITHVDFSVSVGTVVPRHVELRRVPRTIVEIVPQYRDYDFFVVRDEIVIVQPHTHRIVDVIERGPSHVRAETTTRRVKLSRHQREIIRRHAHSRRTVTTGSGPRTTTEITVGERLPDTVEVESFPETVYREVPAVREYRYIERGDDVYLVDPSSRRVIEEVR